MTIKDLGYHEGLESFRKTHKLESLEVGRIALQHKERYVIKTSDNEFDGELVGNLRFMAESRRDFPAVGDWVAFMEYDEGKALIHAIFPRNSIIERRAVGKSGEVQIIATNVDYGLIVQAVDRDFNLNRLERYLTICNASGVEPIIVLSKIDLITKSELDAIVEQVKDRMNDLPIFTVSNQDKGYADVKTILMKAKTYCLLGSSGVGKSTLLNNILGEEKMITGEISTSVNKGKHVTSHRELIVLQSGAIIIDNPGMREVGIADSAGGLETTFNVIVEYSKSCRFKDCTHTHEKGCAILEAVENGDIDNNAYANYRKMQREQKHFESDAIARKKKDKDLGKLIKRVKKQRKNEKF